MIWLWGVPAWARRPDRGRSELCDGTGQTRRGDWRRRPLLSSRGRRSEPGRMGCLLLSSNERERPMLTRRQLIVVGITMVGVAVVGGCAEGAREGMARTSTRTPTPVRSIARGADGRFSLDPADRALPKSLRTLSPGRASDVFGLKRLGLGWIGDFAFSPDGLVLAEGTWAGLIRILDSRSGGELARWLAHRDSIRSVGFSADGTRLASGSGSGRVGIWDPDTGLGLLKLDGHSGVVSDVAFSPDGRLVASASHDDTVKLWDPVTGQELRTLGGDGDLIVHVAFSSDGGLLASANVNKTVTLWHPKTGRKLRTLEGHTNVVVALAFSPDGKLLASGGADGAIWLWGVPG